MYLKIIARDIFSIRGRFMHFTTLKVQLNATIRTNTGCYSVADPEFPQGRGANRTQGAFKILLCRSATVISSQPKEAVRALVPDNRQKQQQQN